MTDTPTPTTAVARPADTKAEIATGGPISGMVPQSIDQAWRLATALAGAGDMIPKNFQGNPPMIMAAIAKGMEVGLAPMQALASIAVINGRATVWGDAIPALVQRAGHFVDVEIEGEGDKMVATATLTRSDGRKIIRRFSMEDAKRAGLAGKPGPWQQYPQRMLSMRARTWAAGDGAADALMGLEVAEEVQDYGPDRARDVTPQAPRKGGVVYRDPAPQVDEVLEHHEPDAGLPTAADVRGILKPTPADLAAAEAETLAELRKRDEEA